MEELQQLGRYQIKRVLGRGAMGVVYEGVDPKLNRPVAIKTILKSQLSDPEMAAEYQVRFEREAQAVARLSHPHIVGVFDFGEENNVAYIVMELIRGEELKAYFDKGTQFAVKDAVRMTGELLDALGYAHEQGIVHRDVKPANVMLDAQMRVKLTDFGVARLSDTGSDGTQAGTMVGTPSYMSPEQAMGNPVGTRSDIFAVGIVLYQLLTLKRPFVGDGHWAVQRQIIQDDPVPPSVQNPALDPVFDAIVFRALAKNPEERYPYARAFKEDLQRALAGQAIDEDEATLLAVAAARARPPGETGAARGTRIANDSSAVEIEFWKTIKDSSDPDEFELYIAKFPNGTYADLARRKLAKLHGDDSGASRSGVRGEGAAEGGTRLALDRPGQPGMPAASGDGSVRVAPVPQKRGKNALIAVASVAVLAVGGGGYFMLRQSAPTPMSGGGATANVAPPGNANGPSLAAGKPVDASASQGAASGADARVAQTPSASGTGNASASGTTNPAVTTSSASTASTTSTTSTTSSANTAQREAARLKAASAADAERRAREALAKSRASEALVSASKTAKPNAAPTVASTAAAAAQTSRTTSAQPAAPVSSAVALHAAPTSVPPAPSQANAANAQATSPSTTAPTLAAKPIESPAATEPKVSSADLLAQAAKLQGEGKLNDAVRLYKRAARGGSGQAAKQLGDIYGNGSGDVPRDYAESIRWYNVARTAGVDVPDVSKR
ncbi:serine/threonine-protein kinase [Paraburkholderia haematera]|uniref:Serine/threonine-protein kinase PknD n=1 Tax=Paraburkholderia haematera TaxID=2793077 RepID=A0ABN7KRZ9_9BURK|nr:serine/threonine-protein kinase [Paraburkholderia haematera]CAE6709133.1 Serine/threonine-protein kinase PknD [Paraburkholderia haematera]